MAGQNSFTSTMNKINCRYPAVCKTNSTILHAWEDEWVGHPNWKRDVPAKKHKLYIITTWLSHLVFFFFSFPHQGRAVCCRVVFRPGSFHSSGHQTGVAVSHNHESELCHRRRNYGYRVWIHPTPPIVRWLKEGYKILYRLNFIYLFISGEP